MVPRASSVQPVGNQALCQLKVALQRRLPCRCRPRQPLAYIHPDEESSLCGQKGHPEMLQPLADQLVLLAQASFVQGNISGGPGLVEQGLGENSLSKAASHCEVYAAETAEDSSVARVDAADLQKRRAQR